MSVIDRGEGSLPSLSLHRTTERGGMGVWPVLQEYLVEKENKGRAGNDAQQVGAQPPIESAWAFVLKDDLNSPKHMRVAIRAINGRCGLNGDLLYTDPNHCGRKGG